MRYLASILILAGLAPPVLAQNLIRNGDFESLIGDDWQWRSLDGPVLGNWNAVTGTGRGARLGGQNWAHDLLWQSVELNGIARADLQFDLVHHTRDFTGSDILTVQLYDVEGRRSLEIGRIDLGDDDVTGYFREQREYHFFPGRLPGADLLVFEATTDGYYPSAAYVDNVTLQAVPEPASLLVMATGAAILLRYRLRKGVPRSRVLLNDD